MGVRDPLSNERMPSDGEGLGEFLPTQRARVRTVSQQTGKCCASVEDWWMSSRFPAPSRADTHPIMKGD
jgi:hypothetical protein